MSDPHLDFTTHSKQQLRLHLKSIRQHLPKNRQEEASKLAFQQLSEICQNSRFVLSFASFGSEIDLWLFNEQLCAEERLVLPVLTQDKLELFLISDFNQLIPHQWGMLEPNPLKCLRLNLSEIEYALIPGLGFDTTTHYRLGYGKGYYDRLLASASAFTQTLGVGFLEQTIKCLPYSKEDIPMNHLLLT